MKKLAASLLLALAIAIAGPATATITVYTDRAAFDAAVADETTLNFPEQSQDYYGGYSLGPVSFQTTKLTTHRGFEGAYEPVGTFPAVPCAACSPFLTTIGHSVYIYSEASAVGFNLGRGFSPYSISDYTYGPYRGTATTDSSGIALPGNFETTFIGFVASDDEGIGESLPLYLSFYSPGSVDVVHVITGTAAAVPDTAGVVPEPASWAMMIAGFGLIGYALRRRKVGDEASVAE